MQYCNQLLGSVIQDLSPPKPEPSCSFFPFPLLMEDSSWDVGRMNGSGKKVSSHNFSILYAIDYLERGESTRCPSEPGAKLN